MIVLWKQLDRIYLAFQEQNVEVLRTIVWIKVMQNMSFSGQRWDWHVWFTGVRGFRIQQYCELEVYTRSKLHIYFLGILTCKWYFWNEISQRSSYALSLCWKFVIVGFSALSQWGRGHPMYSVLGIMKTILFSSRSKSRDFLISSDCLFRPWNNHFTQCCLECLFFRLKLWIHSVRRDFSSFCERNCSQVPNFSRFIDATK